MSTDRKIKGHAGSYGVAKYGLLVFRIPGAAGDPANWFEWLGVPCHRAGCRPAKRAAIRLSSHWLKNAKAFYGFLVRWKGSSLSIERSTGPFSQIFSLRSKVGHSCSNPFPLK